jgi:hypothetical protein
MLTHHQKITESLKELGYTGWAVNGTEIEWIVEPEIRPTQEQIDAKVLEIESILEAKANAKAAQKTAILERIGLTEEELQIVLGA